MERKYEAAIDKDDNDSAGVLTPPFFSHHLLSDRIPLYYFSPPNFVLQEDAQDAQEAAQQDARLQAEGVAEIDEERARQIAAVDDGADPKKEAARIRERHIRDSVSPKCRNAGLRNQVSVRSCEFVGAKQLGYLGGQVLERFGGGT